MKKLLYIILSLLAWSCNKDLGNYSYSDLNDVIISNIDELYTVDAGTSLHINPKIDFLLDQNSNEDDYLFEWLFVRFEGYNSEIPDVISESKNLVFDVTDDYQGITEFTFRVTDKKTGVYYDKNFKIHTITKIYEGYFVLSESTNQEASLDYISYDYKIDNFVMIRNVIDEYGNREKIQGRPNFIHSGSGLILGTTSRTTNLFRNGLFGLYDGWDIRVNFLPIPNSLGTRYWGVGLGLLASNNGVYSPNDIYRLISKMSTNGAPFKASQYVSRDIYGTDGILFNEDASEFVYYAGTHKTYCDRLNGNNKYFDYRIDKDLIYMRYVYYNGGSTFALLKDKVGDKVYLARFTSKEQLNFREITGSLLHKADLVDFNDKYGYIHYSVGSKVYTYDFNIGSNVLIADYGERKISLLKVNNLDFYGKRSTSRKQDLSKDLVVCTYQESNVNGSGIMDVYSIKPLNAVPSKLESFDGFNKIVSTTYFH